MRTTIKADSLRIFLAWILGLTVGAGVASAQSFTGLDVLPGYTRSVGNAVSADGSVVVGESSVVLGDGGPSSHAFRWTRPSEGGGGMVDLGLLPDAKAGDCSLGYGVSGDGSVVAGWGGNAGDRDLAFRWTRAGGMESLGVLPQGGTYSQGRGVSGNGLVIIGNCGSTGPNYRAAFRWTRAEGMVSLGHLPGGRTSDAAGVSEDGSVVVGTAEAEASVVAFRWTDPNAGGTGMVSLGTLHGGIFSAGHAVSGDGLVIVGSADSAEGEESKGAGWVGAGHRRERQRAFRWTASGAW